MKLTCRFLLVLLISLQTAACTYWQPELVNPREVLAASEADHVRLTRRDGRRVEVKVVEIRGDSVYGNPGTVSYITCEQASEMCDIQIPISDVGLVERRGISVFRTAALVLGPLGAILIALTRTNSCVQGC